MAGCNVTNSQSLPTARSDPQDWGLLACRRSPDLARLLLTGIGSLPAHSVERLNYGTLSRSAEPLPIRQ
jgi:hypothetical protein